LILRVTNEEVEKGSISAEVKRKSTIQPEKTSSESEGAPGYIVYSSIYTKDGGGEPFADWHKTCESSSGTWACEA
jgi:hypothetical protein